MNPPNKNKNKNKRQKEESIIKLCWCRKIQNLAAHLAWTTEIAKT
jgi:hypothetical protein